MSQSYKELIFLLEEKWGIIFRDTLANRRDMLVLSGWHCSEISQLPDAIAWRFQAWEDPLMTGEAGIDNLLGIEEEIHLETAPGSKERIRFAAISKWPGKLSTNYSKWLQIRREEDIDETWIDFFPIAFSHNPEIDSA